MRFWKQEDWSGLPSPAPVDHVLSKLFTMTHLSWEALHGMAHSFIELQQGYDPGREKTLIRESKDVTKHISDKGLVSKLYKDLSNSAVKKKSNPVRNHEEIFH